MNILALLFVFMLAISGCTVNVVEKAEEHNYKEEIISEEKNQKEIEITPEPTLKPKESVSADYPNFIVETAPIMGHAPENNLNFSEQKIRAHITNVEEFITKTIRPLYQEIVKDTEMGGPVVVDNVTWNLAGFREDNDEGWISHIRYDAVGDEYTRNYYFDIAKDVLIFSLQTNGEKERRLYFYKDSVIRYIDENGKVYDNPEDEYIIELGERAVREAYVYWD